ncbi:MAG: hypothetical protein GKR94_06625 [Gammaproteobacteria bacterium]|nr:hypothetical protein [Gammaproteobacteria bacterium]
MDLSYGPQYETSRQEIRAFLKAPGHKQPQEYARHPNIAQWQHLLASHGIAARTVPKELGTPERIREQAAALPGWVA